MALLHYFTPVRNGGLPDSEGVLASVLPPHAIQQANQVSGRADEEEMAVPQIYTRDKAAIGKYICENGVAAAARYFPRKWNGPLKESIIRSI